MGKISQVSSKYIIHSEIEIEGVVDKPDVIGAIFGQTEGLLGADLELRELQRSGRIGRIEVNIDAKSGKSRGAIIVPSSLDKAETSIIAAALEVIQRIGPCNAKLKVKNIEDVRVSKRKYVVDRAKELLRTMIDDVMPDSQELADEVAYSVRVMEVQEYGKDRLPAGPAIDESDDIILVEGRADVLNLLKHGFKNVIAMNGTSCPTTIKEICHKKEVTVFVDGDRGGDLIIKELMGVTDIDFVAKAPDGKEVEEITKKEIHKALRGKVAAEQFKMELDNPRENRNAAPTPMPRQFQYNRPQTPPQFAPLQSRQQRPLRAPRPLMRPTADMSAEDKAKFSALLEELIGTKGAYILDEQMSIMGKIPFTELAPTLNNLSDTSAYAVVLDGTIEPTLVQLAEKAQIKVIAGMESKATSTIIAIVTPETL